MKWSTICIYAVLLFVGTSSLNLVMAQPEATNWIFGDKVWIKFQDTVLQIGDPLPIWSMEASASVSDSNGTLQFYTDGVKTWNRMGEVISIRDIELDDTIDKQSITQGVLILPSLTEAGIYYIFGIGEYAKVDMNLNAGMGGMVFTPSWQPYGELDLEEYEFGYGEKSTAVRHGNGIDWWIIQPRLQWVYPGNYDSTIFSFLLSEYGI